MLTKNELRALWEEAEFRPRKRWGQNFLIDKNIKDKILRNLQLCTDSTVIEIGPGFGELTIGLAGLAKKVFAVEKDRKIVAILKNKFKLPSNLTLIEKDFLDLDIKTIAQRQKVVVYGNLPYYVTSPIIEKLFENISLIKNIYLVIQKEVADRILAKPGTKAMGRLSLYVQYYTEPERVFKIGQQAFYPVPQVESVLVKLKVRKKKSVDVKDEALLFGIIKKAYSQRRKTILNSLSGLGLDKDALSHLLKTAKLDPKSRPETLSLSDFSRLANILANSK